MAIGLSGTSYIDALLMGKSFTGDAGQATTVGYAFDTTYVTPAALQGAFLSAMQAWSNVANVTFNQVALNASTPIIYYWANLENLSPNTLGSASLSGTGSTMNYADIAIDDRFNSAAKVAAGTQGYVTILHEIGHALGLEHPGDYGQGENAPHLPGNEDNLSASLMSYYNSGIVTQTSGAPQTPMLYDIAAIQYLYGANTSYNSGNSTYSYNGKAATTATIWDGGGSDTLDASAASRATIDLREGLNNYSTIGKAHVWVAFNANIENANGSKGADTIYGTSAGNLLVGNKGNDVLYSFTGNDTVYGDTVARNGSGKDVVYADAGNDVIYGGGGNDSIWGGADNDLVYGDGHKDYLSGDAGSDVLYGGADKDTLLGDVGNDTLAGEAGNDTLYGGVGDDALYGGAGKDAFYYGSGYGQDTIFDFEGAGKAKTDVIHISSALGYGSTAALAAAVNYVGLVGTLDFGGGNTLTIHATATLTASDFILV